MVGIVKVSIFIIVLNNALIALASTTLSTRQNDQNNIPKGSTHFIPNLRCPQLEFPTKSKWSWDQGREWCSVDARKLIIMELVKHATIPILCINDYIMPVSSCYEALFKEMLLGDYGMINKKVEYFFPQKTNNKYQLACVMPIYPLDSVCDRYHEDWSNEWNVLTERDVESLERLPNDIAMCLGNVACGASMLGILLILTFCK